MEGAFFHLGMNLPMKLLAVFLLFAVGGSIWSSNDLYTAWASKRTFVVGDNLVFRFEMGMYNVVQVSRWEYEDCTAYDPCRAWNAGPAVVPLDAAAVRYFICTVGNYCALGVKLYVATQNAR